MLNVTAVFDEHNDFMVWVLPFVRDGKMLNMDNKTASYTLHIFLIYGRVFDSGCGEHEQVQIDSDEESKTMKFEPKKKPRWNR